MITDSEPCESGKNKLFNRCILTDMMRAILYTDPAAEMGGGMEEVMEMDKEEVCREILLEDGDNDDDMNEMRDGMMIFLRMII